MKNYKTTKQKWELKMKEKEPLQCWIVNIMSYKKSWIYKITKTRDGNRKPEI